MCGLSGVWDITLLKNKLRQLKIFRSLKVRIFLIMLMVGLIPCFVMRHAILNNYERRAVNIRTSDITTQLKILANHLITYSYLRDTSSEVINAELEQLSNLYDGRVLIISSDLKIVKDTYGISEGRTIISEEVIRCLKGDSTSKYDRENGYIEMTIPITESLELPPEKNMGEKFDIVRGVMLVSASNDSIIATMDSLNRQALVVEALVSLAILVGVVLVLSLIHI